MPLSGCAGCRSKAGKQTPRARSAWRSAQTGAALRKAKRANRGALCGKTNERSAPRRKDKGERDGIIRTAIRGRPRGHAGAVLARERRALHGRGALVPCGRHRRLRYIFQFIFARKIRPPVRHRRLYAGTARRRALFGAFFLGARGGRRGDRRLRLFRRAQRPRRPFGAAAARVCVLFFRSADGGAHLFRLCGGAAALPAGSAHRRRHLHLPPRALCRSGRTALLGSGADRARMGRAAAPVYLRQRRHPAPAPFSPLYPAAGAQFGRFGRLCQGDGGGSLFARCGGRVQPHPADGRRRAVPV